MFIDTSKDDGTFNEFAEREFDAARAAKAQAEFWENAPEDATDDELFDLWLDFYAVRKITVH